MKILPALLTGLLLSASASADSTFSLTSGLDYSSGKYGNATATDILYVPVTGKYVSDGWTLKLTVPYIRVTGPGGVTPGMGRIGMMSSGSSGGGMGGGMSGGTSSSSSATRNSNSGLGDVVASAGHEIYSTTQLEFDLVGNVKFGTADANLGLGTGRDDYSMQLDGYYTFDESTLFGTLGYKKLGSPPGISLNNVLYGTIGSSRSLSDNSTVGASLDMAQRASTLGANQLEASLYVSEKFDSGIKITANVLKGFSDGSPDIGGSLMVSKIW